LNLITECRRKASIAGDRIADIVQPVRLSLALSTFALTAALASGAGSARIARDDLVVEGRVKTLQYEALDEFGLNGQMTARLTITRVVRGRPPSAVLTIRYIEHSYLPEDSELHFHLRPTKSGIWLVCSQGKGRGYVCQ
jgi:hypothetical protein